jgi:hypothetical protein
LDSAICIRSASDLLMGTIGKFFHGNVPLDTTSRFLSNQCCCMVTHMDVGDFECILTISSCQELS